MVSDVNLHPYIAASEPGYGEQLATPRRETRERAGRDLVGYLDGKQQQGAAQQRGAARQRSDLKPGEAATTREAALSTEVGAVQA